jgi:ABC-type glutathione transport system ATPase component
VPEHLLQVRNLSVRSRSSGAVILCGINFVLSLGETVGIVGESGAGKSFLARSLLGLLDPQDWIIGGSILWRGRQLVGLKERELRTIRGKQIALIPQEPELALHPLMRAETQIEEAVRAHYSFGRRQLQNEARSMLAAAELPDPSSWSAFPHQLSGGQLQRVAIAQALVARPALLIADEPTSALDNLTQAGILELCRRLKHTVQLALIWITHDIRLLGVLADRILVMREGTIVEQGPGEEILNRPGHEYTKALLAAIPTLPEYLRCG